MSISDLNSPSGDDAAWKNLIGTRQLQQREQSLHNQSSTGSRPSLDDPFLDIRGKYLKQQAGEVEFGKASRRTAAVVADAVVPANSFQRPSKSRQPKGPSPASDFSPHLVQGLAQPPFEASQLTYHASPLPRSLHGFAAPGDMSNPTSEGYGALPYYGPPGAAGAGPMAVNSLGGMQMVYGSNTMAYPGQMLHHAPYPMPSDIRSQMLSPGALARLQRASADSKRGKRRRPASETSAGAGTTSGTGDAGGGTAQVVPSKSPVDLPAMAPVVKIKEERRKKRLLRNRVSAQQARERKRQHLTELEEKCNKMEEDNTELEERISQLTKENEELRQMVRTHMRFKGGNPGSNGPQQATDHEAEQFIARPRAEVARPMDMAVFGNLRNQGRGMG